MEEESKKSRKKDGIENEARIYALSNSRPIS